MVANRPKPTQQSAARSTLLTLFMTPKRGRFLARVILQAVEKLDEIPEIKTEIKGVVMTISSDRGIAIWVNGTTVEEYELESLALVDEIEEVR